MAEELIRYFCYRCRSETNHSVLYCDECVLHEGEPPYSRLIKETWRFLKCRGCDSIKVHVLGDSPDFRTPYEKCYPPFPKHSIPRWVSDLNKQIQDILLEIDQALHMECLRLATMGIRTLIDIILVDSLPKGDIGGFEQKMKKAVSIGIMTESQKEVILPVLEAGHAASHRAYCPSEIQVLDALQITEHLLEGQYILPDISKRIKADVPERKVR